VTSEQTIVSEGRRLVEEAAAREIGLRLVGGAAIWIRASEHARDLLGREYPDLDLIAHRKQSRPLRELLEELDYEPQRTFNATHGARRLLYHARDRSFHLDVFLDEFVMSHTLDLGARLELESPTLPAAELLLTKLQVAEVNMKDLNDAAMLLLDHEIAENDGPVHLNAAYVAAELAADWGLYTTVGDNIDKLCAAVPELLEDEDAAVVLARANTVRRHIEAAPKSRSWKLRAKVGRRVRWYELPEEVTR
jgi:ribosomal protein S15P/S13E